MRIRPALRAENLNVQGQIQSPNPCLASTQGLVLSGSSSARQRGPVMSPPIVDELTPLGLRPGIRHMFYLQHTSCKERVLGL